MKYNNLRLSNLKVSQICLGTMTFGNPIKEKSAIEMVHWCIDNEINFFCLNHSFLYFDGFFNLWCIDWESHPKRTEENRSFSVYRLHEYLVSNT